MDTNHRHRSSIESTIVQHFRRPHNVYGSNVRSKSMRVLRKQLSWQQIAALNERELAALTKRNTSFNGCVFPAKTRRMDVRATVRGVLERERRRARRERLRAQRCSFLMSYE